MGLVAMEHHRIEYLSKRRLSFLCSLHGRYSWEKTTCLVVAKTFFMPEKNPVASHDGALSALNRSPV